MLITDVDNNDTILEYYKQEDIISNLSLLYTDEYIVINVMQDEMEEIEDVLEASEHLITCDASRHSYLPRNYLTLANIDKFAAMASGGYIIPGEYVSRFYKELVR